VRIDHINRLARRVRAQYRGKGTAHFNTLLKDAAIIYRDWNGRTLSVSYIKGKISSECHRLRRLTAEHKNPYTQLTLF